MCKRHLKYGYVKCVAKYSRRKRNHITHAKKAQAILGPSQRYQDTRHLLQNPKVPRIVMGFSNCAQPFNPLNYLCSDSPFNNKKKNKSVSRYKKNALSCLAFLGFICITKSFHSKPIPNPGE